MMKVLFRLAMALCAVLVLSAPAFAQMFGPAVTTANVNMRQGAGPRHAVIRVLRPGEEVNITRCANNWCLVEAGRTRGWVYQTYLRRLIVHPGPSFPGFNFGEPRACFYERADFRGASFCLLRGQGEGDLGNWRNRISSVSIEGRTVTVDLCRSRNFRDCTVLSGDMPKLSRALEGAVVSVRVW